MILLALLLSPSFTQGQVNGQGQRPYMGWSSFSQQTIVGNFLTESQIRAQSDALKSSGLQSHGYVYINIDSGWQGSFDGNGRPIPGSNFPSGMAATVAHIHSNGQKAGIYWIPGVEQPVVNSNPLVLGTSIHVDDILVVPHTAGNAFGSFHNKIDFSKPGAQEYVNSIVNLFASWGIDFIKLDGVTPGSTHNDLTIDNRQDVKAWSIAIQQSGRPIWFTISWALDHTYVSWWQQWANARRIDLDVECEGRCSNNSALTDWAHVSRRFSDLVSWQHDSGPALGWNDLDSLEVGDANIDGLSQDERQTAMTIWAIANAPLYIGDDLTHLDSFGLQLLTNDEVIAVDQSAHPGLQVTGGNTPVWAANQGNGTFSVALFNLNGGSSTATVNWNSLGLSGSATVRDLWAHRDLGNFTGSFSVTLPAHGSSLVQVTAGAGGSPLSSGHTYRIVNANSGSVVDDPAGSTANGTKLIQWQTNGGSNQQWTATAVGSFWTFTNAASGKLMDDPGSSTASGTQLVQWQSNGGSNQQWSVVAAGNDSFKIINRVSGLLVDVSGASTTNGSAIIQQNDNGAASQHWTFQLVN